MRASLAKVILVVFCISFFHLFLIVDARSEDTGLAFGGFQWNGAVELGYRFTDIDGSRDRYKETVNLMQGLRLFDLNLFGRNLDTSKGLVDYFSLTGREIGDPFPGGRLEIKKNKVYDFVATYNQYHYWSNREDNLFLTDNHDFSSRFSVGTMNLLVFPKEDLQLNLGYRRWDRDGDAGVPRLNLPFALPQDLKEGMNEYSLSADFPIGNWDFHVKQSFWNLYNKDKIESKSFAEDRNQKTNTVVSTIKAHTHFDDRWDLDTALVYAHSQGRAEIMTVPQVAIRSGNGDFQYDTFVGELGLSYLVMKKLILHADYRFHNFDQDGSTNTDPFLSPGGVKADTNYKETAHTGTLQLEYLPLSNLTLRGGYQFQSRDMDGQFFGFFPTSAGGKNPVNTNQWTNGWVGSIDWKPLKVLSVFGEYKGADTSDPYTWISPDSSSIARLKIKYDTPLQNLSLKGIFTWRRRLNNEQEYRVDSKDYTLNATYQPAFLPKLTLDASFTYENIKDHKDIFNVIPFSFSTFNFNSSALIYSAGVSYEGIYKGLGARMNASYAKTMKENAQRYADAVLSIWYKNKCVTPIISLEKTYLHDHVKPADSFDAKLLTFSLRKEF